jgi:hypothetical protein
MRLLTNWLESYLDYTAQQESPEIFHFWSAVAAIAATSGRSTQLDRGAYTLFPNHYIFLMAGSSKCKKSVAVGMAMDLLTDAKTCHIMSERITNAAFYKHLAEQAGRSGRSEVLVFADELSMFLNKDDARQGLLTTLTRAYSCPKSIPSETIGRGAEKVKDTCVNVLVATTPTDFGEIIPSAATGKGFTPRLHLIYQEKRRHKKFKPFLEPEIRVKLINDLQHIKTLQGSFKLTPEDDRWVEDWYNNLPEDAPNDVVEGYYFRKHDAMLKLSMVLSLASRDDLFIRKVDMEQAIMFLDQMEKFMPQAYQTHGQTETSGHADRVLKQIERRGGKATRSEIMHDNWYKFTARNWEEDIAPHLIASGLLEADRDGKGIIYKQKKKG